VADELARPRPPGPAARGPGGRRRYRAALAALVLGTTAFAFQQTAVVPALPTIEAELAAPPRLAAWLLTGYLLVAAVSAPLLGKLGDRYGKRRLILFALACFFFGSVGAALSPSMGWLIAFRLLQGLGGAVFPLAQSVVRDEAPEGAMGTGMGWLTGAFGLGGALGLGLTGVIVELLSWQWVFVAGALLVVLAIALVRWLVPPSPRHGETRLDLAGAALLGAGLALVLIPITEGARWGWLSPPTLGLAGLGLAVLAAWGRREFRSDEPLVDLRALAARPVLYANLTTLLLGYVLFGVLFLVPHLVEADGGAVGYGFGANAIQTGLFLLPSAIGQLVAGPLSGTLARRLPLRTAMAAGLAVLAAASVQLALAHTEAWQVAAGTLVFGIGLGLAIGPAATLVAEGVRQAQTGVATALNSVTRRVGGAVGGQVAAALLAVIALRGDEPAEGAFTLGFLAMAVVSLVGIGCALRVPRAAGSVAQTAVARAAS
jgi:EmrB/QacA subfamily drug resistance transporter